MYDSQFDFYCVGSFLWETPWLLELPGRQLSVMDRGQGRPRDLNVKPFLFYCV